MSHILIMRKHAKKLKDTGTKFLKKIQGKLENVEHVIIYARQA